jgi:serine/threonine protein kinase
VLKVFLRLCRGIEAVHAAGAIHRDIKPDNVMFLDGRLVVTDLGLAKFSNRDSTTLTQTHQRIGTRAYMATEQLLPGGSRSADERTDVCQLGKVLYELVTGESPVLRDYSKCSAGLAHIIGKATKDRPDDRYQSVGDLMKAIKLYEQSRSPNANPIGTFDVLISRIDEAVKRKEYREKDIRQLFAVMGSPVLDQDKEQFLTLFDQIPIPVLEVAVESFDDDFLPVLRSYVAAIDDKVGTYPFNYAESVAKKMWLVLGSSHATPEMKAMAIEAVLIASTRLNRFNAIESFHNMLKAIKDDDDAMEVVEVLDRHDHAFYTISDGVAAAKLHPTIRAYHERRIAERAEKERARNAE